MFACFKDKTFLKRFFQISLPVMLSSFVTFLVTFIDNIMVGSVSNEAVSGVYAANEVTFLFELGCFGILEGAGIFIQQYNGSKDNEHMQQCFRYKILVATLFLLISMPLVYLFGKDLIYVYCKKDANSALILEEGIKYLNVAAISYIFYTIGMVYSTSLREVGLTKYSMYASLSAVICNVVFNSIFILWLKMGGVGAAIATIISRIVEMSVLILITHIKKIGFAHKVFSSFKIEQNLFKNITRKSYLLFINEVGWAIGVILQSLAFSQRDGVLSSISIVTTVSNIFQILITGLSIGIGVMVGSSLGQDNFDQARDEVKKLIQLGLYGSLFFGFILIAFSPVIPLLFSKVDVEQQKLATYLIIIYGGTFWAKMVSCACYFTLKAGGKTVITFCFDTGLMLLLFIPLAWILALFTNLDLLYIYLIIQSIEIIKVTIGVIFIKKIPWAINLTKLNA